MHTTLTLWAAWTFNPLGSAGGPNTVFGIGLVIAALVALLTSMRRAPQAEFALPTAVAAVGSLLLLVVVLLGPPGLS